MMENLLAVQGVDRAAVLAKCDAMYDQFDTDNNGVIDQDEMEAALAEVYTLRMRLLYTPPLLASRSHFPALSPPRPCPAFICHSL